jgi:hypothetical protein
LWVLDLMTGFIGTSLQITVDYNSSQIELLQNNESLSLLSESRTVLWSLESWISAPSRVASFVTTDGQSASLSWKKAPIWGLRPDFYASLSMWGAFSDERAGLSYTIAAGPRQRSHSRVRVPWDSWPYFTVSDSRLPLSSPSTTRRTTVEVFDRASTWEDL